MANGLYEIVRRLSLVEKDVRRISTWERPTGGGGGGTGEGAPVPHALAVSSGFHSGKLPWVDLNTTGSNLTHIVTRNYSDLQNRTHDIVGADHSIAAGKWSLVGAAEDNNLDLLIPSSVVSGPTLYESILKSDSAGGLELVKLTATEEVATPLLHSTGALTISNEGSNDIRIEPSRNMVLSLNRRFISDGANLIGYPGNGFGIWTDPIYHPTTGLITGYRGMIETDNLTVRGRMNVYELVIRQIRSTNGNVLVSSASKIKTVALIVGTTTDYTITVEDNTYHGFFPGDLIKAQRWRSEGDVTTGAKANIYLSEMTVLTTPNLTTYTARLDNASDPPEAGFDYVRHGSTTEVDRQGMVYIAADETNSPYIAIINGVSSWGSWYDGSKIKGLIGNINGSPIALPPDATGYEYGMVFGTGWTPQDRWVKVSNREALFNKIDAKWYNGLVQTVGISHLGTMEMGQDISLDAKTSFVFTAATGILALGRRNAPAITFNGNTGASYFTGLMTIANTGEIRQGVATTGNVQSDAFAALTGYTGFRLWATNAFGGQVGQIGGYNNNVLQWSATVDGSIMAGAGGTFLNARGLGISRFDGGSDPAAGALSSERGVRWFVDAAAGTTPMAAVIGGVASSRNYLSLTAYNGTLEGSLALWDLGGGLFSLWLNNIDMVVGLPVIHSLSKSAGGGFDEAIRFGTNGKTGRDYFQIADNIDTDIHTDWLPDVGDTRNLGSPGRRWLTLYAKSIVVETEGGGPALSGQVWQYNTGDMQIQSNADANRTLYIVNTNAGYAHNLDVDGNITLSGTVDGYDVGALGVAYYAAAPDFHPRTHALVGSDHTVSGLTAGHVLTALTATTFGFAAPALNTSIVQGIVGAMMTDSARIDFTTTTTTVTADIKADSITNTYLANMAANTVKGAVSAGNPVDLTVAQLVNILATAAYLKTPMILADDNLTLRPTDNLILDPQGKYVLPDANHETNLGSISKKYHTLHAGELWVETLVAQNTIATIGGRILVGPTTTLTADLSTTGTTITVKHNNMDNGDIVYMESGGKVEYMKIVSVAGGVTGAYTYTVTRHFENVGGGTGDLWYAGDAVFNTGQLTSIATLSTALTTTSTSLVVSTNTLAAGDAFYMETPAVAATYNPVTGVEATPYIPGKNEAMVVVSGPTGGGPYTYVVTRGASGTTADTWAAGELIYRNHTDSGGFIDLYSLRGVKSTSQYGPTIAGNVRTSNVYNAWETRWAVGNLDGLYDYGVTTYGFAAGKKESGWISADATNGLRIMQGSMTRMQIDATGDLRIKGSDGTDAIALLNTGQSYFAGVMLIGNLGEIRQGSIWNGTQYVTDDGRTFAYALDETYDPPIMTDRESILDAQFNGLRIWQKGSIGYIGGYRRGVQQWAATNEGMIAAGGGLVRLQEKGLTFQFAGNVDTYDYLLPLNVTKNAVSWMGDLLNDTKASANITGGTVEIGSVLSPYLMFSVRNIDPDLAGPRVHLESRINGNWFWFSDIQHVYGLPGVTLFTNPVTGASTARFGTNGAGDWFEIAENTTTRVGGHWIPSVTFAKNLGADSLYWGNGFIGNVYARKVVITTPPAVFAAGEEVGTLSGEPALTVIGDMTVTGVINGDTSAAYADLTVSGNITIGGSIDGVDVSELNNNFNTHVGDTNIHHNRIHAINGADHSLTGGVAGTYLRANSATTFGFSAILDADLPDTILRTSVTIVAGAGQTGGGALSGGTVTLNVGAGDGITVSADAVALASSVAGNGLTFTAGVLAVGAGDLIDIQADTVGLAAAGGNYRMIRSNGAGASEWATIDTLAGAGLDVTNGVLRVGAGSMMDVQADTVGLVFADNPYYMIRSNASGASEWQPIDTLAGAGMTSASGVLNVIGSSSISVLADSVGVLLAATSGLVTAGGLQLDDNIAGNGLVIAGKILAVGTPAQLSVASDNSVGADTHSHPILSNPNPGQTAAILATDGTGALTLYRLNATNMIQTSLITSNSGEQVTLTPDTYVVLSDGKALRSATFSTGFAGSGFSLDNSGLYPGKSYLEVDNITVRGMMNIYELVIQKIRSTNGNLFVTTSFKVTEVTGTGPYVLTDDEQSDNTAVVGDLLRAQKFMGTNVYVSNVQVTAVAGQTITVTLVSGSAPAVGFEYARLGNTTDPNRQGGLYLSADDAGSPFMDVWNGLTAHTQWNTAGVVKARFGRLDGIMSSTNEYGMVASGSAGFSAASGHKYIRISNIEVAMYNVPLAMYNGSVNTARWLSSGSMFMSDVNVGTTEVDATNEQNRSFFFNVTDGALRIGKRGPSQSNLVYSGGTLQLRNDTTAWVTLATTGSVQIGQNGLENILIDTTSIKFRNSATVNGYMDSTTWVLGQEGSTQNNIKITPTSLELRYGTVAKIRLDSAGDAYFSGDITATSGSIAGTLAIGASGSITWGPGFGVIDNGGIRVIGAAAGAPGRSFRIMEPAGVNHLGQIGGYRSGTSNIMDILAANVNASGTARLNITADASGGLGSMMLNIAGSVAANSAHIELIPDTANGNKGTIYLNTEGGVRLEVNSTAVYASNSFYVAAQGSSSKASLGWDSGAGLYKNATRAVLKGDAAATWGILAEGNQAKINTAGTAAAPALAFETAATNGIYYIPTNTIGFSTNGSVAAYMNSANLFYSYGGVQAATTVVAGGAISGASLSTTGAITAGTTFSGDSISVTGTVSGVTGSFTTGGVTATAGGSPGTYTPYRFNNTHGTGLLGSPGGYVGLAVAGIWHLLSRADGGGSSYIALGAGNQTLDRSAYVDFYTQASDPYLTTPNARIIRNLGANGTLIIAQYGTGSLYLFTNGADCMTLDTNNNCWLNDSVAGGGTFLAGDGTAASPAFRFRGDTNTGMWWSAADTISWTTGGANRMSLGTTYLAINVPLRVGDGSIAAPSMSFSGETDSGFYRSAANAFRVSVGGKDVGAFVQQGTGGCQWGIASADNGAGPGSFLSIGRNTNATTPAGAMIWFTDRGGTNYYLHADDNGVLRIGTTSPISTADTTNGAVGLQSSALAFKNVLGTPTVEDALTGIALGAEAVRLFRYKDDLPFSGEDFSGIVVDYAPRYGTDKSELFPHGQSLNVVNAIGDLMIGTAHLHKRIENLEAEVAELKRRLN